MLSGIIFELNFSSWISR